jgi:hypothetical protein
MGIPIQDLVRKCRVCGIEKPIEEFLVIHDKKGDYRERRCKDCRKKYRRDLRFIGDRSKQLQTEHNRYYRIKKDAYDAYGNACNCCGEKDPLFLSIDHINNDGNKQRKIDGICSGVGLYYWLKRHGYPENYQILCYNCNVGRARNKGVCPHKVRSNDYPLEWGYTQASGSALGPIEDHDIVCSA